MLLLYGFAATAPGHGAVARAEVYDDFAADAIDSGKWTHSTGATFFSQSNGRLHFPCTYGGSGCTSFSVDNVDFTPAPLPEPLSRALQ
jgi:hypothetical protein